ncbi:MAG: hypothetical protein QXU18_05125 [Thermoplasmatales archaeon]
MDFQPDKTIVVLFDTEWYVPREARSIFISSLKANPLNKGNQYLGGVFYRFHPLKDNGRKYEKTEIFADSLSPDSEKAKLKETYDYFVQSWEQLRGKRDRDADLITIGIGNSRFDLPSLYARSVLLGIDKADMLYEIYLKTKAVDLSDVAIPYIYKNRPRLMYPITANEIASRFGLQSERKASGKTVWDMVEANDFDGIKERVRTEVSDMWKIYDKLLSDIFRN